MIIINIYKIYLSYLIYIDYLYIYIYILSFKKIINVLWIRWWCSRKKWMGFHSHFRRGRSLCYYGSPWMQWPLWLHLVSFPDIFSNCHPFLVQTSWTNVGTKALSNPVLPPWLLLCFSLRSSPYYLIFTCYFIILDMGLLLLFVYGNSKMHPCLFGSMLFLCITGY